MDKVFIVMIHDKETRPYICGVYATREEAEESCLRLNHGFNGNGMFADFISEIVQKRKESEMVARAPWTHILKKEERIYTHRKS